MAKNFVYNFFKNQNVQIICIMLLPANSNCELTQKLTIICIRLYNRL